MMVLTSKSHRNRSLKEKKSHVYRADELFLPERFQRMRHNVELSDRSCQ